MAISIEIGKSGENEASHSPVCPSGPFAMLRDGNLRAGDHDEPHPLLLLPDGERAAWEVLRDLPSVWEQERSKSPLGLLYSRQVGCLIYLVIQQGHRVLACKLGIDPIFIKASPF